MVSAFFWHLDLASRIYKKGNTMASELLTKIKDDIKSAMKAHDAATLSTLRTLHSDIKNEALKSGCTPAEIENTISDDMVLDVLAKSLKQKNEAIEILTKGGFADKIGDEQAAIEVYQKYLPSQLTEEEVVAIINEVKAAVGATSPKDMGKMMKELTPKTKGRFDSKKLSGLVQAALK